MRDTPRTDAAALGFARIIIDWQKYTTIELVDANFARTLERELAACQRERDALREDAERYRWLRAGNTLMIGALSKHPIEWYCGTAADAAIDEARKA